MRKFICLISVLALTMAFGFGGAANADEYADEAVSITRVTSGTASGVVPDLIPAPTTATMGATRPVPLIGQEESTRLPL